MAGDNGTQATKTFTNRLSQLFKDLAGSEEIPADIDGGGGPHKFAINSEDETRLLEEVYATLEDPSVSKELVLFCLRGRKYDVAKACETVPKYVELRKFFELDSYSEQLEQDIASGKITYTGGKDLCGRQIILIRYRFHNPRACTAKEMVRLLAFSIECALMRDPEAQQQGISILADFTGVGVSNLDPGVPRLMFTKLFTSAPIRIGNIMIVNVDKAANASLFKYMILPLMTTFLNTKLKGRIKVLSNVKKLLPLVDVDNLLPAFGGTMDGPPEDVSKACSALKEALGTS